MKLHKLQSLNHLYVLLLRKKNVIIDQQLRSGIKDKIVHTFDTSSLWVKMISLSQVRNHMTVCTYVLALSMFRVIRSLSR